MGSILPNESGLTALVTGLETWIAIRHSSVSEYCNCTNILYPAGIQSEACFI